MKPILSLLCLVVMPCFAKDTVTFEPSVTPDVVFLDHNGDFADFTLTVTGPAGFQLRTQFQGDQTPFIDLLDEQGAPLADGLYRYSLTASPHVDATTREALRAARESGVAVKQVPEGAQTFGFFTVQDGSFVMPETEAPLFTAGKGDDSSAGNATDVDANRDVVHNDDVIATGSLCVGFDCVNGEVFGFDTIRLKENNLRIKFMDTSVGAFPTRDWEITANSNASGGGQYLAFNDIDSGRTPFLVEGNAPASAMYLDDGGRLGLGTSTPVVDLQVVSGNTPTLRLEQNGTSGFAPQTWDLAGNETSFFIRDATNGSTLPFRIRPGAPNNALNIGVDGSVGVGILTPTEKFHVTGNGRFEGIVTNEAAGAQIKITDTTGMNGNRFLLAMSNQGNTKMSFENTVAGSIWEYVVGNAGQFYLFEQGNGAHAVDFYGNGDMTINGTLTENSDVNAKENIEPIEPLAVLDSVLDLPITTWNYKDNCDTVRHMGPMAQDFHGVFGLNGRDDGISTLDSSGVALGAIQGLNHKLQEEIAAKNAQIEALEARLNRLEALLLQK